MKHSVIKWLGFILCNFLFSVLAIAQPSQENILRSSVNKAVSDKDKIIALNKLSHYYYCIKQENEGDILIDQMILMAEKSQDKKLIKTVLFENPSFLLSNILTLDVANQKKKYAERALDYAKRINDPGLMALAYIQLSSIHLNNGSLERADYYAELANTNAMASGNDTSIVLSYLQQGSVSNAMSKAVITLQKFSNALALTIDKGLYELESKVYQTMAQFYKDLGNINTGRENIYKSMALNNKHSNAKGVMYDNMLLAKMCEKNDSLCERSALLAAKNLADSLQDIGIQMEFKRIQFFSYYDKISSDSMIKILDSDQELKTYFRNFGPGNLDWVYGQIFLYDANRGKEDSAVYYFKKAEDSLYKSLVMSRKKNFVQEFALANSKHNIPEAIKNYKNLLNLQEQTLSWSGMAGSCEELMKLYEISGDFRKAYEYNKLFDEYNLKYSDQSKKNEVDLLTLENDQKEKNRELELALEAQKRSYNLQYLFIAILIFSLFTLLAMMGFYKVSRKTVRMVGFFSFLLLFEFVILLSKKWMNQYTHGTPWQDLLFMIFLAILMLPLHHWLEHEIIEFLTNRNLIKGLYKDSETHKIIVEKKAPFNKKKERGLTIKKIFR